MRCQKCGKLLDDTMSVCPICNTIVQQRNNYTTAANQYNNSFVQQNDAPQRQTYAAANSQQPYQHQQVNTPNSNWNPPPTANQNQQMQTASAQDSATETDGETRSLGATILDFSLRIALILGILIYEIVASASAADVVISIVILTMLVLSMVYSLKKKKSK